LIELAIDRDGAGGIAVRHLRIDVRVGRQVEALEAEVQALLDRLVEAYARRACSSESTSSSLHAMHAIETTIKK
jgi:hypothetical protein